jgi:hypothetical protein
MTLWPIVVIGAAVAYIERERIAIALGTIGQHLSVGMPLPPAAQKGNPISTSAAGNALASHFRPVSA